MDLPASVEIVEVGPRDGLQNEAANVPTPEKTAPMEALTATGVGRFEATSFISPKPIPQLADAQDALTGPPSDDGVAYCTLIPNERGYERATASGPRSSRTSFVIRVIEGGSKARTRRPVAGPAMEVPWVLG